MARKRKRSSSAGDFILGKNVKNPFDIDGFGSFGSPKRDSRRAFTPTQKKEILYQQDGKCARCHKKLDPRAIQFDHKKAWASGGRTITQNGRALCSECHDIISHNQRLKRVNKKRKPKDPFSLF